MALDRRVMPLALDTLTQIFSFLFCPPQLAFPLDANILDVVEKALGSGQTSDAPGAGHSHSEPAQQQPQLPHPAKLGKQAHCLLPQLGANYTGERCCSFMHFQCASQSFIGHVCRHTGDGGVSVTRSLANYFSLEA